MTLTHKDLQSIVVALQPEFTKLEKKLTGKIDRLRRENRADHNLIIKTFDERDHKLQDRVSALEAKSALSVPNLARF